MTAAVKQKNCRENQNVVAERGVEPRPEAKPPLETEKASEYSKPRPMNSCQSPPHLEAKKTTAQNKEAAKNIVTNRIDASYSEVLQHGFQSKSMFSALAQTLQWKDITN